MTSTEHANTTTIGTRPTGRANGTERWATITNNDGVMRVTAYQGWGITDEIRLHGIAARAMAERIARDLIAYETL